MSKTKAQLEHENAAQRDMLAAQRKEIEALRDLIEAAAACADVPIAAAGYHGQDDRLAWRRTVKIRASLRNIDHDDKYLCAVLAGMAQSLRETAAEPVTYEVHRDESEQDAAAAAADAEQVHVAIEGTR